MSNWSIGTKVRPIGDMLSGYKDRFTKPFYMVEMDGCPVVIDDTGYQWCALREWFEEVTNSKKQGFR